MDWIGNFYSLIGKFQEEIMRTTPSGSDNTSPLAGKKRKGISLCNNSPNKEKRLTADTCHHKKIVEEAKKHWTEQEQWSTNHYTL